MIDTDYFQAGRTSTCIEILQKLSQADCSRIRAQVAENPAAAPHTLELLMVDNCADVRIAVARNPNVPVAILWMLAMDDHLDVRYSIAENANTPPIVLFWLTDDENPYIAQRAAKTIDAVLANNRKLGLQGELTMSAKTIERTLRRMLSRKARITKGDAIRLKHLILEDGHLSKSEMKIINHAIKNDLLDDSAFEIFLELLLDKQALHRTRAIA